MATPTLPHSFNRVAVLGSGVMGSAIACHLAQTGHELLYMLLHHMLLYSWPGSGLLVRFGSAGHITRFKLQVIQNYAPFLP